MPTQLIDGSDRKKIKASRKPILLKLADLYSTLDKDIKKLQKISIKDTPKNREVSFWNDSVSQSFAHITSAEIIGDGLKIRCKNKKAKDIIDGWNRHINVRRKSIEDYIKSSWIDSVVHGPSYWRILENPDLPYKVDIQRLDPKTIKVEEDPKYGWRVFIQNVGNFRAHKSKYAFYRQAGKDVIPGYLKDTEGNIIPYTTSAGRELVVTIPDEPHVILHTEFFEKSPVASVIHFINFKKWVALFMRKYAQKHWAPFILAFVGDPTSNTYPESPEEMQQSIDFVVQQLQKITSFGAGAFPGDVEIKALETQTARSSEIYVTYMKHYNKEIMMGMYGSMGLREASGVELATSRTLEHGRLRFLKGIRRQYELSLTSFYAFCLLPLNGIEGVKPSDIDIEFSPLRFDEPETLMEALLKAREAGVFKDMNEIRKAASGVFDWLEELPEKENTKFDNKITPGVSGNALGSPTPSTGAKARLAKNKGKQK